MVFKIIWEMFYGKISLSLVLLLLLANFVSWLRLELMYISLIIRIRSSLTYLHGFQLLVLLPWFIEITFFICSKRINLLSLKESSDRLVIVAKAFLKLPNLHILIKQKSLSLPRNLALRTFGKFLIVFSTKVNLLYLLYSTIWRCFLLHLIKQNCLLKIFLRTLMLMTQVFLYLFSLLELVWNWSWLYSSGGSKELWTYTFTHTSWTLQYVSEGVFFSRLLEGLICGPCI